MTQEELEQLKENQMVFCFNTPYVFSCFCGDDIIFLNPRMDFDSYIVMANRSFCFISLKRNDSKVLNLMEDIKKGSLEEFDFNLFYHERQKRSN